MMHDAVSGRSRGEGQTVWTGGEMMPEGFKPWDFGAANQAQSPPPSPAVPESISGGVWVLGTLVRAFPP